MKIRILMYKYKWKWVNFAIQAWTWVWNWRTTSYSHCEVWAPRENGGQFRSRVRCRCWEGTMEGDEEDYHKTAYWGDCWSSTMRGDYNGTVKRPASEVITHPERWDYYEIEISDGSYCAMVVFMEAACERNKGYDKPALLKFFLPFWRKSTPDKYICSEFVQAALHFIGIFDELYLWSPRRLSRKLGKLGYKVEVIEI